VKLDIDIINRSAWPGWFLAPLCQWVAERAGIKPREIKGHDACRVPPGPRADYTITFKRAVRPSYWRGMNYGRRACNLTYHRRGTGCKTKDHRFQWGPTYDIRPGIEMLVYLMAHEMYHSTGGHPDLYRLPSGRTNRDLMEHRCNEFGAQTVAAFRAEWPEFRARLLSQLRAGLARRKRRVAVAADRAASVATPDARLDRKRALLKRWESKAKRAGTAIRKLRRSIAAIERRAAAK